MPCPGARHLPPWRRERQLLRPSGPSGGGAFSSRPTQVHSSQKFSRRRREPTVSSLLLRPGASARLSHPPMGRVGGRPISCSAAQGSVRRSGCWRWVLGCALPRRLVAEADGGREQDAPPPHCLGSSAIPYSPAGQREGLAGGLCGWAWGLRVTITWLLAWCGWGASPPILVPQQRPRRGDTWGEVC